MLFRSVISVKKGYMKFFDWFIRPEPHNKYNFSIDYVFSEMEKYKTKKEFHCNDPVIYRYALKYYRKMYDKYWENKRENSNVLSYLYRLKLTFYDSASWTCVCT